MSNPAIGLKKTELDTPCLIIDKNILKSNLETMRKHSIKNKVNVRPHCKTHKCSKLAHLQIEYGAIGVSVAKISEAEVLIQKGVPNILITSPIVTQSKIDRLVSCLAKAPSTLVVVDNKENMSALNEAGMLRNKMINVLIDVDAGIGRTGVKPQHALNFALEMMQFPWLNLMGIQCYAGNLQHIHSFSERRSKSLHIMEMASDLVKSFRGIGLNCSILTGSGTGTYDIDVEATEVTEIQPGSYTVMDVQYASIGSMNNEREFNAFKPAMTLLTTVISNNRTEHVTVDAGTKSIYVDNHKPEIISHQGLQYDWGGFGDEHGKVSALNGSQLPGYGEVLELVVPHCDPTINLFDQFYIVENDVVVDVWDIDLRGKSQ
ncbi:DSD1 family PLP-dependent enzyme [Fluoribacter dumoffii]|uniref:D-threonine aldolase n=1 Tax=Fluoribacter dumoffii TaxID=463 RepID=A0A377GCL9_9GAMM|nr:DSD1 family PLP-dependent enzyme [Fluoribacter dumoffii]KTC90950.1 alanine racemase [Fluoribacter dumoffii NY 23]MCW8386519.1 DSD1 family PLP-dependent enzyme [Fluoribacter dumoffii]MCW8419573.1 DSD1 family PLP-dependent enzyme [Fluoribacter dumoffii]MCW8455724.1 DSD1 family PLP-dependent enzyme [Fluoribacter dumoffii]MCW8460197.1 DSD1 family PLP-dependent enzyme [Fluoribacter dumoffii]